MAALHTRRRWVTWTAVSAQGGGQELTPTAFTVAAPWLSHPLVVVADVFPAADRTQGVLDEGGRGRGLNSRGSLKRPLSHCPEGYLY